MVKDLSAQSPAHSLRDGVGFGAGVGPGDSVDADTLGTLSEIGAIDGITIAEQLTWFLALVAHTLTQHISVARDALAYVRAPLSGEKLDPLRPI